MASGSVRKSRRTRVFLGAYANVSQAQCLNCRALACHLDKSRFQVGVRILRGGGLSTECFRAEGFTRFKSKKPNGIRNILAFIRGLIWCDVAYLPQVELRVVSRIAKCLLRKKSFATVECICSGVMLERALKAFGSVEGVRNSYSHVTHTFAITEFMIRRNQELIGLPAPSGVLRLGVDSKAFSLSRPRERLTDIVMIGADLQRKGLVEYLALAKMFPELRFHVVGGLGNAWERAQRSASSALGNVIWHGPVSHSDLRGILEGVQLQVFPSRDEGFPKVILEVAAAGIPSIVYADYGANEWMTDGVDGCIVRTFDEIVEEITALKRDDDRLARMASAAQDFARRFDWSKVIADWQDVIEKLHTCA